MDGDRCSPFREDLSIRDLGSRPCLWHTAPNSLEEPAHDLTRQL